MWVAFTTDCFIAITEFQIFSAKSIMMVKVISYLAKKFFRFLPKPEVPVYRCSMKKLFQRFLKKTYMQESLFK